MDNESTTNTVVEQAGSAVESVAPVVAESTSTLMNSVTLALQPVFDLVPKLVGMLIVLVIGFLIAKIIARAITVLCEKIGLHTAAERGGLVESMQKVGIQRTVPQLIGAIGFWLLMCVFLIAACDILQLEAVTGFIKEVAEYIPRLLVASVIIVVGLLIATFLRGVIATSADRIGITYAQQLAAGCYYVLSLMVFIAAFDQLEIKFEVLNSAILIAFGAVAVGFGLAFGLGGRDVMAGILSGYYVRQRMQSGDHVSVAGFEGTVRDVGPVTTIVETEEEGLLHRHSVPNVRMLNEAIR